MIPPNIKSGFKNTGIFLLDLNRFPENQLNHIYLKVSRVKKEQGKKKNEEQGKKQIVKGTIDEEIKYSLDYIKSSSSEKNPPLTSRRNFKFTSQGQEKSVPEIQEKTTIEVVSTPDKYTEPTSRSKSVLEMFAETLKSSVQIAPTKVVHKTTENKRLQWNTNCERGSG